jgi:hypothetical protein
MTERRAWIGDDVGGDADFEWSPDRGNTWSDGSDEPIPKVRNPIGFMRFKPVVRIKAWTRPMPRKAD